MNTPVSGTILIDVPEVAWRLREPPHHIRRSLLLLAMMGIANETDCEDLWRLSAGALEFLAEATERNTCLEAEIVENEKHGLVTRLDGRLHAMVKSTHPKAGK